MQQLMMMMKMMMAQRLRKSLDLFLSPVQNNLSSLSQTSKSQFLFLML